MTATGQSAGKSRRPSQRRRVQRTIQQRERPGTTATDLQQRPTCPNDLTDRLGTSSHRGVKRPLKAATTYTLMSTDRKVDDLFRQHRRILQTIGRWLESPEKVQQQSAATAPTETGLRATRLEPLTCVTDLQRPSCLQMVRRRSTVRFRNGAPAQHEFSISISTMIFKVK
jgi:hypothetical protein